MNDEIRRFVVDTIMSLGYSAVVVQGATPLGEGGLDLDSLAVAELATLMEQRFGVVVDDDELERLPSLTVDDLVTRIAGWAART